MNLLTWNPLEPTSAEWGGGSASLQSHRKETALLCIYMKFYQLLIVDSQIPICPRSDWEMVESNILVAVKVQTKLYPSVFSTNMALQDCYPSVTNF